MTTVQSDLTLGVPDPRPVVERTADAEWRLVGVRCTACGYPVLEPLERCPVCGGPCAAARFGPLATVFAATVLRVPVPGRAPPYALAYVDVDDGPRLLVHVDRTDGALAPGTRVRLAGSTDDGDPLVAEEGSERASLRASEPSCTVLGSLVHRRGVRTRRTESTVHQ